MKNMVKSLWYSFWCDYDATQDWISHPKFLYDVVTETTTNNIVAANAIACIDRSLKPWCPSLEW